MEKQVLVFKLLFISSILSAQNAIKIQKIRWEISIISNDSIFWIGEDNPIQINVKGANNYGINIQGGTLHKTAEGYIVKVKEEGAVTIAVYEKLPNKKMNALYTKLFSVKPIPSPQVLI